MIGIDLVDIEKFNQKKYINKLFTADELAYAKGKVKEGQTLAGIYAAKEAVVKAYGLKLINILRKDINISHKNNKPIAIIKGNITNSFISISHEEKYAIGICMVNGPCISNIDEQIKSLLVKRKPDTHKGDYGKIGVLGGSKGMAGSIYMASLASLRSGCGLSYIIAPSSISDILQIKSTEQIIWSIACDSFSFDQGILDQVINKIFDIDVLAIGPGMGRSKGLNKFIAEIMAISDKKLVIDADALNAIAEDTSILKIRNNIILTPHMAEFARLANMDISQIKKDKLRIAMNFAKEFSITLVLKGPETLITDGSRVFINKIGNPGMATAGSGDVLTGVIATLFHRLEAIDAARLGVYIHALAGDLAKEEVGEESLIASDIINYLPKAFKILGA